MKIIESTCCPFADPALGHLLSRCSALGEVDCGELICSAEAYTPDKNPVVGETAQVKNLAHYEM